MKTNRKINNRFNDATGRQFAFDNLKSYLDFLKKEAVYWEKQRNALSNNKNIHQYFSYGSHFNNLLNAINQWTDIDSWEDQKLQQQLNHLQSSHLSNVNNQWLWSGHEFVPRFIEIQEEHSKDSAESFLNYVLKHQVSNIGVKHNFDGALLGYEYTYQNSDLVKRRKTERATITHLRDQLQQTNEELLSEVTQTKDEFNSWFEATQGQQQSWQQEAQKTTDRLLKVNKWVSDKKGKRLESEFSAKLATWQQRIEDLEQTFKEKLRLEKPAEYWKKSASKLRWQGIVCTGLLIAVVAIGIYGLADFFKLWLQKEEQPINLASIQGAVLFGSIAAIYAFVVRVLSRLTFSSFHLMRDAEEREQLTYLYLSLTEGSEVDKESRDIVLQALFSRSETGLLAQEHGPSMPGAGEIIKTLSKGKA